MLTTQERFRRLVKQYGRQGCVLIVRHINGVTPVELIVYSEGNNNVLSDAQIKQLDELMKALQRGDTASGGFFIDGSGQTGWTSLERKE